MSVFSDFIYNLVFKQRLNNLNQILEESKRENWVGYQGKRLVKTKDGNPVYLIHYALEEDFGVIDIMTTKVAHRALNYFIGTDKWKYIKICDIKSNNLMNQGLGTEVLVYLEEIAKGKCIPMVFGWLSPIDLGDHGERLLHFYHKNGYQITDENNLYGDKEGLYATKYI